MRKWLVVAIAIAVVAVAGYFAMHMFAPPPADLDLARSKPSAAGTYVVSIEPEADPIPQGRLHSWIATVKRPEGAAVTDAMLSIDGGMPQHGHGLPTAPQATEHLGEGRYRVEGVRFNMNGWWELRLTIDSPAGEDAVTFNIVL